MKTTTKKKQQQPRKTASWREAALACSEIITDAWEVAKTYAGRLADWVLFACMVMNIIEILVTLPSALSNIVLGTQVVMLDIGGFSLASMADQARGQGNERAARRAARLDAYSEQLRLVQAEMQQHAREAKGSVATPVPSM